MRKMCSTHYEFTEVVEGLFEVSYLTIDEANFFLLVVSEDAADVLAGQGYLFYLPDGSPAAALV